MLQNVTHSQQQSICFKPQKLSTLPPPSPPLQKRQKRPLFLSHLQRSNLSVLLVSQFRPPTYKNFYTGYLHWQKSHLVKITNHPPLPFNPGLSTTNFTVHDNWRFLLPVEFRIEILLQMAVFYGHLHTELVCFARQSAENWSNRPLEIPCSLIYALRRN